MNEKYPYRFKTEEEFIKDFGDRYEMKIGCGWNQEMNYLFGTDFKSYFEQDDYDNNRVLDNDYEGWSSHKSL